MLCQRKDGTNQFHLPKEKKGKASVQGESYGDMPECRVDNNHYKDYEIPWIYGLHLKCKICICRFKVLYNNISHIHITLSTKTKG